MTLIRLSTLVLALATPLAAASGVAAEPVRHGPPAQVVIATYAQPALSDAAYRHRRPPSRHHRRHPTRRG